MLLFLELLEWKLKSIFFDCTLSHLLGIQILHQVVPAQLIRSETRLETVANQPRIGHKGAAGIMDDLAVIHPQLNHLRFRHTQSRLGVFSRLIAKSFAQPQGGQFSQRTNCETGANSLEGRVQRQVQSGPLCGLPSPRSSAF
jgi:hypothetical protein